jgi:hypothetical protein
MWSRRKILFSEKEKKKVEKNGKVRRGWRYCESSNIVRWS